MNPSKPNDCIIGVHGPSLKGFYGSTPESGSKESSTQEGTSKDSVELRAAIEVTRRTMANAQQEVTQAQAAMGWMPEGERKQLSDAAQDKLTSAKNRMKVLEGSKAAVSQVRCELTQLEKAAAFMDANELKLLKEENAVKMQAVLQKQAEIIANTA